MKDCTLEEVLDTARAASPDGKGRIEAYCEAPPCPWRDFVIGLNDPDPACGFCGRRSFTVLTVKAGDFEWRGWLPRPGPIDLPPVRADSLALRLCGSCSECLTLQALARKGQNRQTSTQGRGQNR
jgi:hypothetical protein